MLVFANLFSLTAAYASKNHFPRQQHFAKLSPATYVEGFRSKSIWLLPIKPIAPILWGVATSRKLRYNRLAEESQVYSDCMIVDLLIPIVALGSSIYMFGNFRPNPLFWAKVKCGGNALPKLKEIESHFTFYDICLPSYCVKLAVSQMSHFIHPVAY